jgi:lysophospholipase L1-like esterase
MTRRVLVVTMSVGLLLVLGAAFIEGLARLRQYVRYGSARSPLYPLTIDRRSNLRIPTPGQRTRTITINKLGFRGPELRVPKPSGTVRIAYLGASTTFCAEASSDKATWPALVTDYFSSRWKAVKFDYVNAGVPGYVVNDSLRNLNYRVAPLAPDIIVVYHATNDISLDTRILAERQGLVSGDLDRTSWLGSYSLAWFLLEKNYHWYQRMRPASQGAARRFSFLPSVLATTFENRLLGLVRQAQRDAPIVAIATFSYRVRRSQSAAQQRTAATTSLFYMPYMSVDQLIDTFDAYNAAIRRVARESGAILIGDEDSIPADAENFNDSVHFRDRGCRAMARRVEQVLCARPEVESAVNKLILTSGVPGR